MFPKLTKVETRPKYRLFLKFSDGTKGISDISHLAGRGVFKAWDENDLFSKVKIDPETNAIVWNEMLDIDPDKLYLEIRGLTFEQVKQRIGFGSWPGIRLNHDFDVPLEGFYEKN